MEQFSIRVSRSQTINGRLLASMNLKEAQAHFKKGKSKFSEAQIKKAHSEAVTKAKELDSDSTPETVEPEQK